MLAELDVLVFLKSRDDLARTAERVFSVLRSPYEAGTLEGTEVPFYEASGLGFHAALFANQGDLADPEFADYTVGLEITSQFWCVELDTLDLDGPLSEYFARMLAFELDLETATEVAIETTEEAEIFEIRSFRRNPQYRLDQAPTTPKVFLVETREVEEAFVAEAEDEDLDGGFDEEEA